MSVKLYEKKNSSVRSLVLNQACDWTQSFRFVGNIDTETQDVNNS